MSDNSDDDHEEEENFAPDSPASTASSSSNTSPNPSGATKKKTKKDILFRARKNLGEKFGSSSMGREMLKKSLADEPRELLECLKRIITVALGPKVANKVEHNIFKLIIKTKFLFDLIVDEETNPERQTSETASPAVSGKKKAITEEQLHAVDKVIRKAFDQLVELFDYYGADGTRSLDNILVHRKFLDMERLLSQIRDLLITMLEPHVTEKSLNRVRYVFGAIGTVQFLKQVWQNPSIENELTELVSACSTYTQFEW